MEPETSWAPGPDFGGIEWQQGNNVADSFGFQDFGLIRSTSGVPGPTFSQDEPFFATEPSPVGLSPTTMFGVPSTDYESLFPNDGLDTLTRVQNTYASDSIDPFAHLKKEPLLSSTFQQQDTSLPLPLPLPINVPQKFSPQDSVSFPGSQTSEANNFSLSQPSFGPSQQQPFGLASSSSQVDTLMTQAFSPTVTSPASVWSTSSSVSQQQPPNSTTASSASAPKRASKSSTKASAASKNRKRLPPSEDTLAERRKKHNEVEIRRRKKMNENFEELQDLIQYERKEKDKASVLRAVIEKLKQYESKTQDLNRNYQALQKQITARSSAVTTRPLVMNTLANAGSPFTHVNSKVNHQEVFMNNDVPMAVANLHGKLVDANERFLQIMGYDLESLRQVPCVLLTHPDDLPNLYKHLKDLLAGSITSFTSLKRMLTKEKRYVHFSNTMWVVRVQGQPKYLTGVFIPVKLDPPQTEAELQRLLATPRPRLDCEH